MLCQNCKKNEATTHIRRIINGRAAEYHFCPDCAISLGFSAPNGTIGSLFDSLFSDLNLNRLSNHILRCETCGCTFDDIVKTGNVGCSDCYELFYDKLLPLVQRLHGATVHHGKKPKQRNEEIPDKLSLLREKLEKAVQDQNYELAAILRDEIAHLEGK